MTEEKIILEELVRASSLMTKELDFRSLSRTLVEQTVDITGSDLGVLYLYSDTNQKSSDLFMSYKRGKYPVTQEISSEEELVAFIRDCNEAVLLLEKKKSPFRGLLLSPQMQSGIALPISIPKIQLGILVLNSLKPFYYNRRRLNFLDSFARVASGMLHNTRLFQELKDTLRRIESLKRYQENIFSSMTNLLVTTDRQGKIQYTNQSARERLMIGEEDRGKEFDKVFQETLDRKILRAIAKSGREMRELPGMEGIYKGSDADMDFSLNVSPLKGSRGKYEGLTLIFTDQTRERELREKMDIVTEDRRFIKDMFSRYLSSEVVQRLVMTPDLVKLGGDKKLATVFFADIRGYTSFSEGKDPEYLIQILNEYFTEAVEIVIKHRGYIDKFIGDCIMAAWGVPLQSEDKDALSAVSCALEIQQLTASKKRTFFKGSASKLKIGIGMHTGPLVAGNLGSSRRMNYTVIGDTVNVAARLEGVAAPGEIIITQETRDFLGDSFRLRKKKPVVVKGKSSPIPIYSVLGKVS
jgi:class 3 adenylate cyclase/GAF domain-containing protein